jgi:hypothetical protein
MGCEIAMVVRRNPGGEPQIFHQEWATADHNHIKSANALDDTGDNLFTMYYMACDPTQVFNPNAYELVARNARFERKRGRSPSEARTAMLSFTDANLPAWLDRDSFVSVENRAHQLLMSKLGRHGGRYKRVRWNEAMHMVGSDMKILSCNGLPIKVRHNTSIEDSAIEAIQPGSVLCGSLNASRSKLTGDGLRGVVCCEHGETFNCEGLRSLTFLPDDFHVGPRDGDPNLRPEYHTPDGREDWPDGLILAAGSGLTMDRVPEHLRSKVRGI